MKDITAIILAAGRGTRMKSTTPKVLHRIGNRTLLERVISNLERSGVEDIVVVVGHKADQAESLFSGRVKFVRQNKLLGSGDAVKQAILKRKSIKKNVLITCGDTPLIESTTYKKLIKKHKKGGNTGTLLTAIAEDPFSYGRIVRDVKNNLISIVEEKDATKEQKHIKEINVGTYCFDKKELKAKISAVKKNEKKKEFYLTDMVKILSDNKKKIDSVTCDLNQVIGINSRKDLARVSAIMNRTKLEKLMVSGVTVEDPVTTWIDESAVIKKDTIIRPSTVIENDVKIESGCVIGPFAHIRAGSKIGKNVEIGNFVETVRTSIAEGTKVKHHTYLGDTVVGSKANIGAGVITANYDGKDKHKTIIGNGVFVGIGVRIIAPVRIGNNAKIGAGSVITKKKNVPAGKTVFGVPAKVYKKR